MTNPFKKIYPGKGMDKILFDGGLSNKFEKQFIADNCSPDCLNVISENGSIETREGYSKLNSESIGTFACDGLYTHDDTDGAQTMVAFFGGSFYYLSGTTFVSHPSATSIFTAGVHVASAQDEGYIFFGNGNITPYKYNGADFTRHEVPAPTATATVASQATGVLTGDYKYVYTNVNSNAVESKYSPIPGTFTAANATIRVTVATAPTSHGVNARKIYRTTGSGTTASMGKFQYVATLANNTATTYDDNIADTQLGVEVDTADVTTMPKYNIVVFHPGVSRLFMNDADNPMLFRYTEAGDPFTMKTNNFWRVGDKAGDVVQGIDVYGNNIFIIGKRQDYVLYMPSNDPTDWVLLPSRSNYGTRSPFGVCCYLDKILYPAMESDKFVGFATFQGLTNAPSTTLLTINTVTSDLTSNIISKDIDQIPESFVNKISSLVFKNKMYISTPFGSDATVNNRVYVFDFIPSSIGRSKPSFGWYPWDGINAAQFTIYDGKIYFGSSTPTGFVYQMFDGTYNDDGSAINSYWETKEFYGFNVDAANEKDFREMNVLIDMCGKYQMDIGYRTDEDESFFFESIDLDPKATLWDEGMFDIDIWGAENIQIGKRLFLGGSRGERIQFKFTNQNKVDQKFKIYYMDFFYIPRGRR